MLTSTLITTHGEKEQPSVIVQSHSRDRHFTTINIGRKHNDSGGTHECSTLSLVTSSHLTAEAAFRTIYNNGLYDAMAAGEVAALAEAFGIGDYKTLAATLIAGRYTVAEELAAHRKALSGDSADLEELSAFAERCKALAKQSLDIEE